MTLPAAAAVERSPATTPASSGRLEGGDARLEPDEAVFDSIEASAQLRVSQHGRFAHARDQLGKGSDVSPERFRDDIEVVADAFVRLGDPVSDVDPHFRELAREVVPRVADLTCARLGIHGSFFADRF